MKYIFNFFYKILILFFIGLILRIIINNNFVFIPFIYLCYTNIIINFNSLPEFINLIKTFIYNLPSIIFRLLKIFSFLLEEKLYILDKKPLTDFKEICDFKMKKGSQSYTYDYKEENFKEASSDSESNLDKYNQRIYNYISYKNHDNINPIGHLAPKSYFYIAKLETSEYGILLYTLRKGTPNPPLWLEALGDRKGDFIKKCNEEIISLIRNK